MESSTVNFDDLCLPNDLTLYVVLYVFFSYYT